MMDNTKEPLSLSDWNQLLVNLKLLQSISNEPGKRGKIKELYEKLDKSLKTDSDNSITYNGFRNQIQEDLKKLKGLLSDPKSLHGWLSSRYQRKELQVRIKPDHFLLNNILLLQGLSFEDLFDKEKLPGQADLANIEQKETDYFDKEENENPDYKLLLQIDDKLDKVLKKLDEGKSYHSFNKRFFDLVEYRFNLQMFIDFFYLPLENGFSFCKESPGVKLSSKAIYALSYMVLLTHINKVHINNHIHKLLAKMYKLKNDNCIFGRMLSPLFVLSILLYLMSKLVTAGINSKRPIFQILEGNLFADFFKSTDFDNIKVSEIIEKALKKTTNLIKHIQSNNLTPHEDYCVKCEILFATFFPKVELLFNNLMPVLNRWTDIVNRSNSRKEIEKSLNKLFKIGTVLAFWIRPGQLDCFDKYICEIEELQSGLEKYYDGYVDESAVSAQAIED
jgi:hypothetical protein